MGRSQECPSLRDQRPSCSAVQGKVPRPKSPDECEWLTHRPMRGGYTENVTQNKHLENKQPADTQAQLDLGLEKSGLD